MRLIVQTREGALQWRPDLWTAWAMVAALADEPTCFAEFAAALKRYVPGGNLVAEGEPCLWREADAEGGSWCLIDLRGETLVAGGGWELPPREGCVQADERRSAPGFPVLWFNLPARWLTMSADERWREAVTTRAATAADRPPLDARSVLYGAPLLEHVLDAVAGCQLAAEGHEAWEAVCEEAPTDWRPRGEPGDLRRRRLIQRIHAEWLMTPRADLNGCTPREIVVRDLRRIDRDLESRQVQWSQQGAPPPCLPWNSSAYRFGGMGTVEAICYFDLVRHLLGWAWDHVAADATRGGRREAMLERLAGQRDGWLDGPLPESSSFRPVSEVIELERTRTPQVVLPEEFDCDCPLCADMAASPTPTFVTYDALHLELEDKFVFSLAETRQEWELDRIDWWEGADDAGEPDGCEDAGDEAGEAVGEAAADAAASRLPAEASGACEAEADDEQAVDAGSHRDRWENVCGPADGGENAADAARAGAARGARPGAEPWPRGDDSAARSPLRRSTAAFARVADGRSEEAFSSPAAPPAPPKIAAEKADDARSPREDAGGRLAASRAGSRGAAEALGRPEPDAADDAPSSAVAGRPPTDAPRGDDRRAARNAAARRKSPRDAQRRAATKPAAPTTLARVAWGVSAGSASEGALSDDPLLPGGLWRESHVDWESLGSGSASGSLARLAIGFPLAEVVGVLRDETDGSPLVRRINAAFVKFRSAAEAAEIRAWGRELIRLLEQAAQACPLLVSRSADLQSRIDEVLRRGLA